MSDTRVEVQLDDPESINAWYNSYKNAMVRPPSEEWLSRAYLELMTVLQHTQLVQNAHIMQRLDTLIAINSKKKRKKK